MVKAAYPVMVVVRSADLSDENRTPEINETNLEESTTLSDFTNAFNGGVADARKWTGHSDAND